MRGKRAKLIRKHATKLAADAPVPVNAKRLYRALKKSWRARWRLRPRPGK